MPSDGPTPESIQAELEVWVGKNWDADAPLVDWRTQLANAGWAVPSWPETWYGRGWPSWTDEFVASELVRLGAVSVPVGVGMLLAAPTVLTHGPDELRQRFLLPALTGEERWCQLFSEPGAGSDLAGVSTTATLDGDSWRVSGQKVWSTSAHHADLAMLLARTDWDQPKHRGLTFLVLPMKQSGVEVRPLRQMNSYSSFNEIFIEDARIPRDWVVGEVGQGWQTALTTLAYERRLSAGGPPTYSATAGRALDDAREEARQHFETYDWYPQRAGRPDLALRHASETGLAQDPYVRQKLMGLISLHLASQWTAQRALIARTLGQPPGTEGSVAKLAASRVAKQSAALHWLLAGAGGLLSGPEGPIEGVIGEIVLSVPAQSIAGGTDEIQRNIVAEKSLGLARDSAPDRDVAYRLVRRN